MNVTFVFRRVGKSCVHYGQSLECNSALAKELYTSDWGTGHKQNGTRIFFQIV